MKYIYDRVCLKLDSISSHDKSQHLQKFKTPRTSLPFKGPGSVFEVHVNPAKKGMKQKRSISSSYQVYFEKK
jgi:hypothetical protein